MYVCRTLKLGSAFARIPLCKALILGSEIVFCITVLS
jgi:hypothetical protein